MSAVGPIATIQRLRSFVRYVPLAVLAIWSANGPDADIFPKRCNVS